MWCALRSESLSLPEPEIHMPLLLNVRGWSKACILAAAIGSSVCQARSAPRIKSSAEAAGLRKPQ
jgi:hypothetical protein